MNIARKATVALAALLFVNLFPIDTRAQPPLELRQVEGIHLDDVWPAPDGERVTELYVRALTRHMEPVDDLRTPDFGIIDAGDHIDPEDVKVASLSEMGRGVSCVIAIDVSRTMRGEPFERAKAAAQEFIGFVEPLDRVAIVTFANEVNVVAPFTASKANAKVELEALAIDDASLNTTMYDGIHRAIELIRTGHDLPRRSFVIVFSDGNDSNSQRSLEQVIDHARGNETNPPVLVFAIGYARFGGEGLAFLEQMAKQTGAVYLAASSTMHLSSFFSVIWRQMMDSYVLRYPADMDGEIHEVEVEVEGHTSTRMARYPKIAWPIWPYLGVVALILLVATMALLIARGRPAGRLVIESGVNRGEVFTIHKRRTSIGGLSDNDIVVPDETVSKYHLLIYRKGRQLEIEDLNSSNGTYVNGIRVRTSPIQPGDRVRIADVDLVYQR